MDKRPIGIFDSGVGGLTSINAVRQVMPNENIIYFGDTARAPYGAKTPADVCRCSLQIADFLVSKGAKILVIACNTITSVALGEIRKAHPDIYVQGIIEPAADEIAARCTEKNSVGVIATMVTTQSRAYENALMQRKGSLNVHSLACPAFVPLIEAGAVESETMEMTIHKYLDDFISMYGIDTLVLGCTHYPIIKGMIDKCCPGLDIIDPSMALATAAKKALEERDLLSDAKTGEDVFYASDLTPDFTGMMDRLGIDGNYRVEEHSFE